MDNLSVSSSHCCKRMKRLLGCSSHHRDWSGLPRNVILCIMDKLTVTDDYVRFGAVCLPWRTIFLEEISSGRPSCCRLPVLLVAPPPAEDTETEADKYRQQRAFYSLSTQRVYDFRLPVPHNKICRGSSFGWLITLETKAPFDCHIQLQNPFLNHTIQLPPPHNIIQHHPNDTEGQWHYEWDWYNVRKAVLSSDPYSSPNHFVVMAIMSKYNGLAYYKPGNTGWTSISIGDDDWYTEFCRNRLFTDVIFFHKTKQFYALLTEGEVFAIDFLGDDHNPKLTQVAPSPRFLAFENYLVEDLSTGDLFQVYKDCPNKRNPDKVEFTVFKLDTNNQNWIHLDNIGENIMFVGSNNSLLRAASECPGCEPNCIYFTDDDDICHRKEFNSCGLPRDGIYNLKHGTIRPHYSSKWPNMLRPRWRSAVTPCKKLLPQLIWLEPTLRRCS